MGLTQRAITLVTTAASLTALAAVTATAAASASPARHTARAAPGTRAKDRIPVAGGATGPSWSRVRTPNPTAPQAELAAVSCSAPTACTAVGDYYNHLGVQVTLAEVWRGSSWTVQPTPNPGRAGASVLSGISCTSPDACTAVGYARQAQKQRKKLPLVEARNGRSWTIEPSPSPPGSSDTELTAVSCISQKACVAVGWRTAGNLQKPLAETWNGRAWAIRTTPLPAGSDGRLYGVSCTSPTACTAVGWQVTQGGQKTLAETWNGSTWADQPTPNATGERGAQGSVLSAVSCIPGGTTCTAVGYSNSAAGEQVTLAEARIGTRWAVQPTPTPTGPQGIVQGFLTGVSCTSRAACSAVGNHFDRADHQVPLMESWNGTAWKTTPAPAARDSTTVSGISCPAAGECTAAGVDYYVNHYATAGDGDAFTLVEAWTGKAWTIRPTPDPAGLLYNSLSAVSCASRTACAAVGYWQRADGSSVTFSEIWNGARWAIQPVPAPASAVSWSVLTAVSCASPTYCVAVGNYETTSSFGQSTLSVIWNGSRWTMKAMPAPSNFTVLSGISCTSPKLCTAVGWDDGPTVGVTLVETWNGTHWTVQAAPNPANSTGSALTAVSCASATSCSAVGDYITPGSYFLSLAEYWNGSTWAIQPTPNTAETDTYLTGVSCPAAGACTASGYSGGGASTLVEVLNADTWTVVATPNPGQGGSLLAVSCSSTTACTAVGDYNASGRAVTLAEAWNGSTWAVQPTPSNGSSVSQDSKLTGVTCVPVSFCMAGGWNIRYYVPQTGALRAVVERYS